MNGEKGKPAGDLTVQRNFEKSPDAISFYCDYAHIIGTDNEVVMQFYETIPAPPTREGKITKAVSLLRATVTFSPAHAQKFGKVLMDRIKGGQQ
jgi:hypothetical protein